jgi:hypothetical protein
MDFTLTSYKDLLQSLKSSGYTFVTFRDYLASINLSADRQAINPQPSTFTYRNAMQVGATRNPEPGTQNSEPGTRNPEPRTRNSQPATFTYRNEMKVGATRNPERLLILRHDVDLKPQNSLATAKIEHELDIKGSYYFRMVPESYNVDIIKEIASLGHEIGYHYETMDTAGRMHNPQPATRNSEVPSINQSPDDNWVNHSINKSLIDAAYQQFCENLQTLRQVADIKAICMHGSPRSKYDNKDIWTKYNYRKLGIIGEPYFDIDFDDFFYLTDTGRRWDGWRVSVRDKVSQQERWIAADLVFKKTKDIVEGANQNRLPERIMITVHPQRWNNSMLEWIKEFILQNLKNIVKRIMIRGIIRR